MTNATASVLDVQGVTDQIKEMVSKLKMPGVDAEAMVEQQRKNLDAVVETIRIANKGSHSVAERQLQLFQLASTQLLSMFAEVTTAEDRANLAKQAFESALAGSREVNDIVVKASEEAYGIARQRVTESVDALRKNFDRKAGGK